MKEHRAHTFLTHLFLGYQNVICFNRYVKSKKVWGLFGAKKQKQNKQNSVLGEEIAPERLGWLQI